MTLETVETPTPEPTPAPAPTRALDNPAPAPAHRFPLQGYRKLLIAVVGLVSLVVLCCVPSAAAHLDKALEGLTWIVASYMGGSAVSKIGNRV